MIYVSPDQLTQVEYLIEQSIQGHHILFDHETVLRVFTATRAPVNEEDAYSVEHHIERMILEPTVEKKRAYLEQLEPGVYQMVVKTYFNIVENNLFEKKKANH